MNFETKLSKFRLASVAAGLLVLFAASGLASVVPAFASPIDRILYSSNRGTDGYDIYAVNVDGTHERLVLCGPLDQMQPEVSPDGQRLIFVRTVGVSCCGPGSELYTADSDGSGVAPLFPPDDADDYRSDFSSDGTRIAFSRGSGGGAVANIFTASPDGSDLRQLTTAASNVASWSPDGRQLVYNRGVRLWVMDADGGNAHPITDAHAGADTSPQWSPKGDRIAFGSTRDSLATLAEPGCVTGGCAEVYTVRPDGSDLVRLTTNTAQDRYATWSPDGSHIAFTSDREEPGKFSIWVMNSDGTDQRRITSPSYQAAFPVYFPHPRPGANRQGPRASILAAGSQAPASLAVTGSPAGIRELGLAFLLAATGLIGVSTITRRR